jgi:4'-phosphopantetheinyl transferase
MISWLLLESAAGERGLPWRDDFLSPRERQQLERLRFPRRRQEWWLGRYAAKVLLSRAEPTLAARPFSAVDILPEGGGAPVAFVDDEPLPGVLSISHRAGLAFVAWQPAGGELGVDVELVEPRPSSFETDYLTAQEQEALTRVPDSQRALAVTLFWSLKEAALKALRQGLRLDTRQVEVNLPELGTGGQAWQSCVVINPALSRRWQGYWRGWGKAVLTVVTDLKEPQLEQVGYLVATESGWQ